MPQKFLEKPTNIFYKALAFAGYSNLFISICAASLTAYTQKLFLNNILYEYVLLSFCATFLLYNGQRLFLALFSKTHQQKDWYFKNKKVVFFLMGLALTGLYPLAKASVYTLSIYAVSLIAGLLYFLPFSNLRKIPLVKSFLVGLVWVLVCIVAPVPQADIYFCVAQLFLITALCVLFNIRDTEHDAKNGTNTLPVLYGVAAAKKVTFALLLIYLLCGGFSIANILCFLLSTFLTLKAYPNTHPFYYLFAVDGIILLQSILGIVFL